MLKPNWKFVGVRGRSVGKCWVLLRMKCSKPRYQMQLFHGGSGAIPTARRWSRAEECRMTSLVDLCLASTPKLKQVHAHVVVNGQSQNSFIAAKLVRAFVRSGTLEHAQAITDDLYNPNIFVWTALIRGYSSYTGSANYWSQEAILLYEHLLQLYPLVIPLSFTLSSVLKACAHLQALNKGRKFHAHSFKHGFQLDSRVQTSLMHFYGKCYYLTDAWKVFDDMSTRGELDLQALNTMLFIYTEAGEMEEAQSLFDRILEPNTHTYTAMVNGYAIAGNMELARQLIGKHLPQNEQNSVVVTAMIGGYARCGEMASSRRIFDELNDKDVASWNAMITAYAHGGFTEEALALFELMINNNGSPNALPNHTTISIIASACVQSGSPTRASWLQAYVDSHGRKFLNRHTIAALIDLHSKSGNLWKAYELFSSFQSKDLVCYSSMIAGFGIHGCWEDAIKLFEKLREANLKPDEICFVSLLTACSHSGKVDEGKHYFELMRNKYHIPPTVEHYMCLVDLLGRSGQVEEAYRLITDDMEAGMKLHAGVWGALLSACRSYSVVAIGEVAVRWLAEIEPGNAGNYVLISNIYAKAQMWGEVARVRATMRMRGIKKMPGWSWVVMEGGKSRKFMTGESYNSELEVVLLVLCWELKVQGYLCDMEENEEY